MAVFNFCLYIYPYAQDDASPPLKIALHARSVWSAGNVVVYFKDFNCDNWWMKYFNPRTDWRHSAGRNHPDLAAEIRATLAAGRRVFADTGVLASFSAGLNSSEPSQWRSIHIGSPWGISGVKHHIQFAEIHLAHGLETPGP